MKNLLRSEHPAGIRHLALLLGLCFFGTAYSEILVSSEEVQTFLGKSLSNPVEGKIVYTEGKDVYYLDLTDDQLEKKKVVTLKGSLVDRGINISPNGQYAVVAQGSNVYMFKIEENAGDALKIGDVGKGSWPRWFVHPETRKTYVLFVNKSNYDHIAQEVDLDALETVGSPIVMFETPTLYRKSFVECGPAYDPAKYDIKKAEGSKVTDYHKLSYNDTTYYDTLIFDDPYWAWASWKGGWGKKTCGEDEPDATCTIGADGDEIVGKYPSWGPEWTFGAGISPDGRFIAAGDDAHGMIELETPGQLENAVIKNMVFFTSTQGYDDGLLGKSGEIGLGARMAGYCNGDMSPAPQGHPYYGCLLHTGGVHLEVFVRNWPQDLNNIPDFPQHSNSFDMNGWYATPVDSLFHIRCPQGKFKGLWATNAYYLALRHDKDKKAVLYDISNYETGVKSIEVASGVDAFHVYIDPAYKPENALSVGKPLNGVARRIRNVRIASGAVTAEFPEKLGKVEIAVFNARGETIRKEHRTNVSSLHISMDNLVRGMYLVNISSDAFSETVPIINAGRKR